MTGLEIFFLLLGISGVALLLAIVTANEEIPPAIWISLFITGLIVLGGSLYGCHGYGYKPDKIKFVRVNVVESKDLTNKVILILDNNEVLVKNEIEWRNSKDNIYKKVTINNFGVTKEEYVIGNKK
jgi:hypothetical protein